MKSEVCLSDVAEVIDSLHKTPQYSEVGWPMVRATDVKYGNLDLSATFKVSREVFEEFSRRYKPKKNDIIVTRVGSYGISALVKDTNFCMGQNVCAIVPNNIDSNYLYAFLNSSLAKEQIEASVVGTTQKTLSLKAINGFKIPRFDNLFEKKIGEIISSFDKRIHTNQAINSKLGQLSVAIFKSWFIDFAPVYAKKNALEAGFTKAQAERAAMAVIAGLCSPSEYVESTKELECKLSERLASIGKDKAEELTVIASLFPSDFEESELGELPSGFDTVKLSGILELAYGKALKKEVRTDGPVPVYGSGGKTGTHNEFLVEGPGIIVGRKGTVGSLFWEDQNFFPIDTVFYVKPLTDYKLNYLFHLLQTQSLETMNTDTSVPGLNRDNVYRLIVPNIPLELRNRFNEVASVLQEKIFVLNQESLTLSQLRDTLLPKLLAGEIDLSGVSID